MLEVVRVRPALRCHPAVRTGIGMPVFSAVRLASRAGELILGPHYKRSGQNAEGRSPCQSPPRMSWNDSADGTCQRQAPDLAPDGKDPASYSYQAECNPEWDGLYARMRAPVIPGHERPADDAQYSSGSWFPCLHDVSTCKVTRASHGDPAVCIHTAIVGDGGCAVVVRRDGMRVIPGNDGRSAREALDRRCRRACSWR